MSNWQLSSSSDGKNTYSESHVMQTCNLLNQYLSGKASLKDLKLGISGKGEATATKDLLTNMGESSTKTTEQDQKLIDLVAESATTNSTMTTETEVQKQKLIDLVAESATTNSTMTTETEVQKQKLIDLVAESATTKSTKITEVEDQKLINLVAESATTKSSREMDVSKASSSKEILPNKDEEKPAQLSIFYGGKVMVFDDFPADKARAVILLASKGIPHNSYAIFQTSTIDKTGPLKVGSDLKQQAETNGANSFDLPIARRSSLYRFLEKRKDKDPARVPYQMHNPLPSSSRTSEGHFDLNF
ncbi:protein TIFY 10B-like isoform X2 [Lycium barbarum]|uniref:protein TIFY 10B-like isoform X2 n=1 Tax=Lycium barbarum TaxID=112863 RepID=UPI00293EA80B|nr:protein TIFY 10B-like isoform X2 [Lycium barbarum]